MLCFFSVCIHKSKYFDIIFYMTGKKHTFFSAGMPQPGFFLKKLCIAIWYMWSKLHINWNLLYILFTYILSILSIQMEPQKIRKNYSNSLERKYSVDYLLSDRCTSTNRNILTLSSIWPVKSTCFFRLECPNRGSFWRNSGLSCAICCQNAIWTCIFLILYTAGASKNKKNQVP